MNLVRCEPGLTRGFGINNLLDTFFSTGPWNESAAVDSLWRPKTDVSEEKNGYRIEIDLPGVKKEDIRVMVEENILKVSGKRESEKREESEGYRMVERSHGSFERTFRLPKNIETDKIESSFSAGVLTLRVPKSEEALPRRIEVKVG